MHKKIFFFFIYLLIMNPTAGVLYIKGLCIPYINKKNSFPIENLYTLYYKMDCWGFIRDNIYVPFIHTIKLTLLPPPPPPTLYHCTL